MRIVLGINDTTVARNDHRQETTDVVIPTLGAASLPFALASLDGPPDRLPAHVIVVDDRGRAEPLELGAISDELRARVEVVESSGRGPAAARNRGWQASQADWVVFLDDDVVPCRGWLPELARDLGALPADVGGSRGRVSEPSPVRSRPPGASRRNGRPHGIVTTASSGADVAFRTGVLRSVGGFDDRFVDARRADADLAERIRAAGHRIVDGTRHAMHPAWPASPWDGVRAQAGRADDALLRALHGSRSRRHAPAPADSLPRHAAVTTAALVAVIAAAAGVPFLAAAAVTAWLAGTADIAWTRLTLGVHTLREVPMLLAASACIPPVALWHRAAGTLRAARLERRPRTGARAKALAAVLFDRDGTLVHDAAATSDPNAVRPYRGAREAVQRLRAAGMRLAVVTNQAAIGEGVLSPEAVRAVNARIDALLGPFDAWLVCPHAPSDGCTCRKPAPGLVRTALRALDVPPERCAFVGDTGADVDAARAAGVRPILVPTEGTRGEEIAAAPEVARDIGEAADRLLGDRT
jgi:histidinol-phosphate phosphatase family protein